MLTKINLKNYKIPAKSKKRFSRSVPKTFAEFLASNIASQFQDIKSLRFYKKCFRKNLVQAQRAALEVKFYISQGTARNPGALFNYFFKKALTT